MPTKFMPCKDRQFFPAPFMRRLARERLGTVADETPMVRPWFGVDTIPASTPNLLIGAGHLGLQGPSV